MWARHVELMLGCWLIMSPFVFRHPPDRGSAWWLDLGWGAVVVVIAALCHVRSLKRLHLATLVAATVLVAAGWLGSRTEALAMHQNHIIVGLLLGMLAIVPSHASTPPGFRRETRPDPMPKRG